MMIGLFVFVARCSSEAIKITTINDSQKSGQQQGFSVDCLPQIAFFAYLYRLKKDIFLLVFRVYANR
jgi:hypothetical protein